MIIIFDILRNGFIQLTLLLLITITAIFVIKISHENRLLITKKHFLLQEKELLDAEWRNLILEKITLENNNRIEKLSKKQLHMIHPNENNEYIIIIK